VVEISHILLEEKMLNNFVGGYAGSGTRVIQMMLEKAGVWVGPKGLLKASYDAHHTMIDFGRMMPGTVTNYNNKEITDYFWMHLKKFKLENEEWSLKNGESMWCIPFLHKHFPKATYILVVKNGLDNILNEIPFSEMYLKIFLNRTEDSRAKALKNGFGEAFNVEGLAFWHARMVFWNAINAIAVEDGEKYYGDRFLIVRLEDFIHAPVQEGQRIFDHLKLEFKNEYVDFIKSQESVGRHKRVWTLYMKDKEKHTYNPAKHLLPLVELGREMLTKLRYL